MENFERLADRASLPAMKFLAVLNLALLIWFAQILVAAMAPAHAQDAIACTADDLLPKIEAESPGATGRMRAEAAKTPNGKGLLWRIEKAGAGPSWLYGTMHLSDPRVTSLSPAASQAFEAAKTVAIETTDVLDPAKMAGVIAADPSLTMFTGTESLKTALPPEDLAQVEAALKKRGVPLLSVIKMRPWFLTTMLAVPDCEMKRRVAGAEVLDTKIAKDAQGAGKQLVGLEQAIDQLRAMNAVPADFHIKGLIGMLGIGDQIDDVFETMIRLYLAGDTAMFKPLFAETERLAPGVSGGAEGYADFEQIMVDKRNLTMADSAGPLLDAGNAFIAVGALHLPGEKGLVEEFRRRGYTVTAAN